MKRRVLAVVVAIVLAAVGTGLVLVYVGQANSRAIAGQKAVTVLVAGKLIPAGTTASAAQSEGLLQREVLPAKSVPANAVRSISPGLSELVASAAIQPGQLLLRPMLVTADLASATGGIAVPPGMVAVTVNLCMPEAVAGYLHPGSMVAVFDTSAPSGGTLTAGANCTGQHSQQGPAQTQLVLGSAEVLSLGPANTAQSGTGSTSTTSTVFNQSSASSSQDQTATLVTLAVPPSAASQLILLTVTGLPYLALLS